MKALIIIASCIALAVVFRAVSLMGSHKDVKSVGAKANKKIPTIDINNEAELKSALDYYKDLAD